MQKLIVFIKRYQGLFIFVFGVFLTVCIVYIRYYTGPEVSLSLFFLLPIFMVTWLVGRIAGILISIVCALALFIADYIMLQSFSGLLIPVLNESFRFLVFLIVTLTLAALRDAMDNLKDLAGSDPLTGVANRRAFFEMAGRELDRSRRYNHPLSVAYIDIDNFKLVNDQNGHDAGDDLLCAIAQLLRNNMRAIDIVARLGGDEFIALFSNVDGELSHVIIDKLQKKLLEVMSEQGWPVTFSIGVVTFTSPPRTVDELITRADAQMYEAKQDGKNMIKHTVVSE